MAECGRLCALQVGIARHNRVEVFLRLFHEHLFKVNRQLHQLADFLFDVQAHIERDLIVSRARRVQPLAGVADALRQRDLDIHVNILVFRIEYVEVVVFNIVEDFLQSGDNFLRLMLLDNSLSAEHSRVRNRAGDVLAVQPSVKLNGGVEIIYCVIGFLLETSCPKLHNGPPFPGLCARFFCSV